jgi:hypothetical protein
MDAQFQSDPQADMATQLARTATSPAAERVRLVGSRVRLATEALCQRPEPVPSGRAEAWTDSEPRVRAAKACAGRPSATDANAEAGCAVAFQLSGQSGANAYSYGDLIIIDPGLVRFAGDDAELAFVLAHEMAHSLLGPRESANREERQRLELTADNIALHLIARAGYDLRTGVGLLRRMAITYPKLNTPDHPALMARFEALERVIAKLDETGGQ